MVYFASLIIDAFSSVIFIIPTVFVLQYAVLKQRLFSKAAAVILFALYSMAVFSITGVPTVSSWNLYPDFNLIPLIDIVNSPPDYIRNTVLNIILFMPFGFLLPAVWKEYRSLKTVALAGLLLSLFIEILQIFTFRLTDVDDLITNTAGSVAGYYISRRFSFQLPWKLPEDNEYHHGRYEPVIILDAAFLITFCLKPLLSSFLWERLLSSSLWKVIR